jgi:DNA-binding MarR family transcriptional regulator
VDAGIGRQRGSFDVKYLDVERNTTTSSSLTSRDRIGKLRSMADRDSIDGFLEQCARDLPDLDLEVEGIVDRIQYLQRHLRRAMEETLAEHGLTHGEWSVLGHLRRTEGGRQTPGHLARRSDLSTGAMTNRLDRLEQAGLVTRVPDPDDRRSVQVELTRAGHEAWERSVGVQAQKEELVVGALAKAERKQLNDLLRRLVLEFERQHGPIRKHGDGDGGV